MVCNSRGDTEAIYNSSGTLLARYTYDSWGKVISIKDASGNNVPSSHIANLNPIRYRGYYYDTETGYYYLQSRYYDPEVGRFISADDASVPTVDISSLYDKNLYAYCDNNPVNRSDDSVYAWDELLYLGTGLYALCCAAVGITSILAGALIIGATIYVTKEIVGELDKQYKEMPRNYTVYGLTEGEDVVYVGRTKNYK